IVYFVESVPKFFKYTNFKPAQWKSLSQQAVTVIAPEIAMCTP
ncbi:hypothetical protein AVEN_265871-1, partial [Araneus ventricosus]